MMTGHGKVKALNEEEISYEERMRRRYSANPVGLLTRYYCASCHKPLELKETIAVPRTFICQDVRLPCKKHPKAGFYLVFVDDRY